MTSILLSQSFAAAAWREELHPRDWRGRFIRTGVHVQLPGGLIGTVKKITPGRRPGDSATIIVEARDGRTGQIPSDRITVADPPRGSAFAGDGTVVRPGDKVGHTDESGAHIVKKVDPNGPVTVGDRGTSANDREVDPSSLVGGKTIPRNRSTTEYRPVQPDRALSDAERRITKAYPYVRVDLKGIDPELQNEIADALEDVLLDFPELASHPGKGGVRTVTGKLMQGSHKTANATFDLVNGDLTFNQRQLGNGKAEQFRRQKEIQQDINWSSPSSRPGAYSVTIHELGHAMHRLVERRSSDYGFITDATSRDRSTAIIMRGAAQIAGRSRQWDKEEITEGLSQYGATKPVETIAESFQETFAMGDRARPLAVAVTRAMLQRGRIDDSHLAAQARSERAVKPSAPAKSSAPAKPAITPVATPTDAPVSSTGRPLGIGDFVAANGRAGKIISLRPTYGIAVYVDGDGKKRSAKYGKLIHTNDESTYW